MKIAMPVDELKKNVNDSFGRTPYFLVYDTETKESIFIDNRGAGSRGAAGITAAQTIVDNKVVALITPRCGANATEVMKEANIKIYKATNNSIVDNIKAINDGKLSVLEEIHDGLHKH